MQATPHPLHMKCPAYAPDLLLENYDQMVLCTENHTQTGFSI